MICDLIFELSPPDPFDCPYMTGKSVGDHFECMFSGHAVWVDCRSPFYGEPPACRYAPIDNSPEACARRLSNYREEE